MQGKNEKGAEWYDYACGIEYGGRKVNVAEYRNEPGKESFMFITNLPVSRKNVKQVIADGRERWRIENEGFNTQKRHGYYLEHMYSEDYQGMKNHYYLIQIGHMIAQIMEAWEKLWEKTRLSREQKHRRMLESWKTERIKEYIAELEKPYQIRFA